MTNVIDNLPVVEIIDAEGIPTGQYTKAEEIFITEDSSDHTI